MKLLKRHLATDRGDDSESYEVTASSLRVRSGPGTQFDTIRSVGRGTGVEVIDRSGEWAQIDEDGWVHSAYLRRT